MRRRGLTAGFGDRIQTCTLLPKLLAQVVDLLLQLENVLLLSYQGSVQRPHRILYERQLRL